MTHSTMGRTVNGLLLVVAAVALLLMLLPGVGADASIATIGPTATRTPTPSPGRIEGHVFRDVNLDGKWRTISEPGITGVVIRLHTGAAAQTSASGLYQFLNLPVGAYTVQIDVPAGYRATTPTQFTAKLESGKTLAINFGLTAAPGNTSTPTATATPTESPTATVTPAATATLTATPAAFTCAAVTEIPQAECEALTALYMHGGGPGWVDDAGWLETAAPCGWAGISCEAGHVSALRLRANGVTGSLAPELADLTRLGTLDLAGNHLAGGIPPTLGSLTGLTYLNLASNQLRGAAPAELCDLVNLAPDEGLDLRYNALVGGPACLDERFAGWAATQTVPPAALRATSLLTTTVELSWPPIAFTDHTGYYEVSYATETAGPFTVAGITNDATEAVYLALSLTPHTPYFFRVRTYVPPHAAPIAQPNALWSDYTTVVSVTTENYRCADVTEIPQTECEALFALFVDTIGVNWIDRTGWLTTDAPCGWRGVTCEAGHVTALSVESNELKGPIPPEIGDLSDLRHLDLHGNRLEGTIPPELGRLAHLQALYLYKNSLVGGIPPALGDLGALEVLNLSNNPLRGSIPPALGNLDNLEWLRLVHDQLERGIPPALGNLKRLRRLDLSENRLSGGIPPELGNLSNLEDLRLAINQLTGTIPPGLGALDALEWLSLSDNQLEGRIPPELGNLTRLQYLYLCKNRLAEEIPAALGQLNSLTHLCLSHNHLRGEVPDALCGIGQGVFEGGLDLNFNALAEGQACIETLNPGWQKTQTVPPTDLRVTALLTTAVQVAWTPIAFTDGVGFYEVSYADDASGPYTVHGVTTDKTAAGYMLTDLAANMLYSVRVRTYTQQDDLWSDYTPAIAVRTADDWPTPRRAYLPLLCQE